MNKTSKAKSFFSRFGNKTLEYTGRLGSQKHLSAMRDAFALMTPLIIAGALSVLIRTFVFGGAGAASTSILGWIAMATGDIHEVVNQYGGKEWAFDAGSSFAQASHVGNFLFYAITHATIDSMGIFAAFGIGYFLSRVRGSSSPVIAGITSLGAFLVATLVKSDLLGAQGLVAAIIISILSTELFCLLEKQEKLTIKMPEGVPPAVARSFAKLLPSMIILTLVVMLNLPFILIGEFKHITPEWNLWGDTGTWTLGDAIYNGVQAPFMDIVGSNSGGFGIAILYSFLVSFLWFFGLHGSNILMGIFSPIFIALYTENVHGADHIFVQGTFDAFIMIGGTGATFGFILAIFLFSKNKAEKEIAKLGIGPAIFQINEPVIFGTPLVLNIRYAIPFVLSMPILTITTWLGFKAFSIHPVTIWIPWTSPVGVGGLLATQMDWKGLLLAVINFAIAFGIWTPFVMFWTRKDKKIAKNNTTKSETGKSVEGAK